MQKITQLDVQPRLIVTNVYSSWFTQFSTREITVIEFPKMTKIEAEFRLLFEKVPKYTNTPPQPLEDIKKLDYPITFWEMQAALPHMKQFACGSDGLIREDLKAANGTDLVCLLNIVFGLVCHSSFILRHNRIVLIPKKEDLSKVLASNHHLLNFHTIAAQNSGFKALREQ